MQASNLVAGKADSTIAEADRHNSTIPSVVVVRDSANRTMATTQAAIAGK